MPNSSWSDQLLSRGAHVIDLLRMAAVSQTVVGTDHSLDARQADNAVAVDPGTAVLYQVDASLRASATLSSCPTLASARTRVFVHMRNPAFCAGEGGFGTGRPPGSMALTGRGR
jgi:hypothetical protein